MFNFLLKKMKFVSTIKFLYKSKELLSQSPNLETRVPLISLLKNMNIYVSKLTLEVTSIRHEQRAGHVFRIFVVIFEDEYLI